MKIRPAIVFTLFRTEFLMVLRDRRVMVASVLLPLAIMPLIFLASNWSLKRRETVLRDMTCRYAVTGPRADLVRDLLEKTRKRLDQPEESSTNRARFVFEEQRVSDPLGALAAGDIHLVLEGKDPEPNSAAPAKAPAPDAHHQTGRVGRDRRGTPEDEQSVPGAPVVRMVFRGDRDDSAACMGRMNAALEKTRSALRAELLRQAHFTLAPSEMARVTSTNIASGEQVAGSALGRMLTLLLMFFILTSGTVVATDTLAGEKERGTLETLLTTAATRLEVLTAKQLVILAVALGVTLIQTLNLLVYVTFKLLPVPPNLAAALPAPVALLLFVLFLPVAALAANVLLIVSGYARTYKEAQLYFFPVFLLALVPALAPFLPGVPLRSAIALVPVSNLAVAAREVLTGTYDWPFIALAWAVTGYAAWAATRWAVRVLSTERLITAADTDAAEFLGGAALFERRVAAWFACIWAILVIVNNYTGAADLRLQLLINLVGIFFGASLLMLRSYRLNPVETLALRLPRPAVWLGVLLGVPGGLLTALGIFRLVAIFVPMPRDVIETFSQAVFPENISAVQLVFFIAVMPGFFEEILFRGMLLHGLRRRLHPAAVAVVVGLVFGLFHVALFRFAPTAFLGILLAAITMLTGSIYPAMVWHALSNALSLWASTAGISETNLDPMVHLVGAGLLTVAFWIVWRNRTPYPGLRPWHRSVPRLEK